MPMLAVVAVAAGATTGLVVGMGMALATAVSYVGIGMTVVGAVTKNKNMMKVGSIMGIAGGVMNIAGIGTASAGNAAGSVAGDGLAEVATDEAMSEVGSQVWGDATVDAASSLTADSFSTAGVGGIEGTAGAGSSAITSGAPASTFAVDAPQSGGLLNSSAAPGAYQQPAIPGASTSTVDNVMTDGLTSTASTPTTPSIPGMQSQPTAPADKKGFWNSLDATTKNEVIKAGLTGASEFFKGWSESEKADWQRDRLAEQQNNLNAQPKILRYKPQTGLLNATTQPKVA